ncbi:MAG: GreA/GreB family elongation factor [Nitrospirae bacterium]|nr:GreA/GreB family elongation factor [Nitrospirota bacterium]
MIKLPISRLEYNNLTEELNKCQQEKLMRGKQLGDIMSNSGSFATKTPGYSETENVIRVLDAKIEQYKELLNATIQIAGVEELQTERIGVYSKVIAEDENGTLKRYYICHLPSANDSRDFLAVTPRSPVGRALMGKMAGDVIDLVLPRGKVELTIMSHESAV